MKIYLITMFEDLSSEERCFRKPSRAVGFYRSLHEAEIAIINNYGDIRECLYDYAVLEEIEEGLYPLSLNRKVYKFNEKTGKYHPIPEPGYLKHIYGMTIG